MSQHGNANTVRIGHSSQGYTPQGQKYLIPADISGLIRLQLTGAGIDRETHIFVRPDQIGQKVIKYAALGQTLRGPGINSVLPESRGPRKVRKQREGLTLICLNDGRFFRSAKQAARHYNLSQQLVNYALKGTIKTAKGHSFRLATTGETEAASMNPDWRYSGELLPVTKGKRKAVVAKRFAV